jgi:hypothetical protein
VFVAERLGLYSLGAFFDQVDRPLCCHRPHPIKSGEDNDTGEVNLMEMLQVAPAITLARRGAKKKQQV